jgi:hypothetical protein
MRTGAFTAPYAPVANRTHPHAIPRRFREFADSLADARASALESALWSKGRERQHSKISEEQ